MTLCPTPSAGSSIPALKELPLKNNVPHTGNDGKTGETLVKTTLAPMFSYHNLRILGWMSYNILGDYDGMVLNYQDNKESKVTSKDSTLEKVLGYSSYTITNIKFFPSLYDNKIAFDFSYSWHLTRIRVRWGGRDVRLFLDFLLTLLLPLLRYLIPALLLVLEVIIHTSAVAFMVKMHGKI